MHKSIGAQIRRILDKVGWEDKTYSLALAEDVGKNSHDDLPKHLSMQFLLGGKVHAKNEDYLTCWYVLGRL